MSTLYRKYRPSGFSDIYGQNHIKVTLEHAISTGKLAHAFLFCGPRGIGKTTMARVLAKAVNCEKRKANQSEPCGKCDSCQSITKGNMLDVIEIDAASHTGVDNVRENIIAVSRLAPSNLKYKVFIIDEVHMLSISAFNALLKILEEPPKNVLFVLCTTEVHKIPATIISRCERYDFKKIKISDIVSCFEGIAKSENVKIEKSSLEQIARFSEGYMRDALSLLGQVFSIGGNKIEQKDVELVIPRTETKEVFSLVEFLSQKNASGAIALVNQLLDDGVDLVKFTSDVIEISRIIMLKKINPGLAMHTGRDLGEEYEKKASALSSALDLQQIIKITEKFITVRKNIASNFIAQLPIEIAIVEICSGLGSQNSASPPLSKTPPVQPSHHSDIHNSDSAKVKKNDSEKPVVDQQEISSKWHEVLAKIKKHNHSLSFILRVCEPRNINGNQMCLAFKYKFHKERIDEAGIKKIVESVLSEVYNKPLAVEAILDENLQVSTDELVDNASQPEKEKNNNEQKENIDDKKVVNKLLETFGGKVVES